VERKGEREVVFHAVESDVYIEVVMWREREEDGGLSCG